MSNVLIAYDNNLYALYHSSNEGISSWYDFALAIFEQTKIEVKATPAQTTSFNTAVERPKFSVKDNSKTKEELTLTIPYWIESLKQRLTNLKM